MKFLERLLFYSIILFLPTQLGKHFWPAFSFIDGLRIDYLSPTIYFTDIIIGLLFILWIMEKLEIRISKPETNSNNRNSKQKKFLSFIHLNFENCFEFRASCFVLVFFAFLLIGILFSQSPMAGFYKLLKIIEFSFFGFYLSRSNLRQEMPQIILLFSAGVLFESFLAISQFFHQGSIGGILWFFGERTFSGQTPGIANASVDGKLILRPYGTFPHPNVLAAYLTIAMTMIISNFKFQISNFKKILLFSAIAIGTISLLLTLSRVAIVLWLISLSYVITIYLDKIIKNKKLFTFYFLLFTFFIVGIYFSPLPARFTSLFSTDSESLLKRQELNMVAIEMIKTSPAVGVGLNNFLVRLPDFSRPTSGPLWLQPAHNIYLLIAAETGIVGLGFSLWFISKTYVRIRNPIQQVQGKQELRIKNKNPIIHNSLFIILALVLVLGLFDHYLLTIQQGQLLLAFVLGFGWAKKT